MTGRHRATPPPLSPRSGLVVWVAWVLLVAAGAVALALL
ncbi:hypothetical protein SAMN05421776_105352 [Nocardia farcinica]|uniref:Uncharacterized protein n=1 Tax=Nocardia farcinica TaxID=37329 RepID=A0A0H5NET4_NOCFR|nr:hypothetical protein CJ469_01887 [Nocardia farcinica]PFX10171.1 hypothetical protein CJ468_01018 [Nocardia farcinica]CRY73672.1 Uncharacterised protein [Nocardia farcinica]SIT24831.1 hypothetical protein SAMN05421776_105352 [Nocardia farcinica]